MKKNSKPSNKAVPKKSFKIPQSFFSQLKEFTNGGFVLVSLDENGSPQIHRHSDNPSASITLNSFGCDYFETVYDNQRTAIRNALEQQIEEARDICLPEDDGEYRDTMDEDDD
jgi:hypothetical protein